MKKRREEREREIERERERERDIDRSTRKCMENLLGRQIRKIHLVLKK
jgi:hypothetical protein